MEARGTQGGNQPGLHSEFHVSMDQKTRPCLKKKNQISISFHIKIRFFLLEKLKTTIK
jgi:hypothetical protein